MFQLDQLGTAILSPIGASVKHENEADRSGKVGERPQGAILIRKGEIRNKLTRFGAGRVAIVGGGEVCGVQLGRDGRSSGAEPPKLVHDRRFFRKIFRDVVRHNLA